MKFRSEVFRLNTPVCRAHQPIYFVQLIQKRGHVPMILYLTVIEPQRAETRKVRHRRQGIVDSLGIRRKSFDLTGTREDAMRRHDAASCLVGVAEGVG